MRLKASRAHRPTSCYSCSRTLIFIRFQDRRMWRAYPSRRLRAAWTTEAATPCTKKLEAWPLTLLLTTSFEHQHPS
ncbi:hypothetical protein PsYK624_088080 [Phanerochaete sordida]|uniref:Uncharacterized protein n=1 Tax=Phanerochaete sordida TaxID=48140 RepID=A0A9P3LFH3_9APHY|nr:hypothetical protein PsYK624_088080 [Phanerochaete sordida]